VVEVRVGGVGPGPVEVGDADSGVEFGDGGGRRCVRNCSYETVFHTLIRITVSVRAVNYKVVGRLRIQSGQCDAV